MNRGEEDLLRVNILSKAKNKYSTFRGLKTSLRRRSVGRGPDDDDGKQRKLLLRIPLPSAIKCCRCQRVRSRFFRVCRGRRVCLKFLRNRQ